MTFLFLGAHPDDCELCAGGTAAKLAAAGHKVHLTSFTDGRSGHHRMTPDALVARRRTEAQEAAAVLGGASHIVGLPDGELLPSIENRRHLIRIIRGLRPDVIVTNRPNDYHPDHRALSVLVQDSAYMLMVPNVVPELDPLPSNPVILFWADAFTFPRHFRADVAVEVDDVFEKKMAALMCHESQFFEWLPWIEKYKEAVPEEREARREWLGRFYRAIRNPAGADYCRDALAKRCGEARAARVVEAEAFEVSEYGRRPTETELAELFVAG